MSRGGLTTGPFHTSQQTRDGVGSMLGHCHGPWANVEPTSGQCSLGWSLVIGFTQQTQDVDPMPVQCGPLSQIALRQHSVFAEYVSNVVL